MFTASEIARVLGTDENSLPHPDVHIGLITIDSRQVIQGEESIFFAIRGTRTDGHLFLHEAYSKGVRNFVVEAGTSTNLGSDANVFTVDSAINALQQLAIYHRNKYDQLRIGITGSNGKTWIKEWLFQLLLPDYNIVKSPRSYNSQIGVPLSVLLTKPEHTLGLFEAGISSTGEMETIARVIDPQIGVLTNIGDAHDSGFENRAEKVREKCKLFATCSEILLPADDVLIRTECQKVLTDKYVVTWGRTGDADIRLKTENDGGITYLYRGEEVHIKLPSLDSVTIDNALCCCALMHMLGIDTIEIQRRVSDLTPVKMRLDMHKLPHNCLMIDDSYSLDLASLKTGLETLAQHSAGRSKAVIISDIEQEHAQGYQPVAELLMDFGVGKVYGIGQAIGELAGIAGSRMSYQHFETVADFLEASPWTGSPNTVFLLKGARKFAFERIVRRMRLRAHSAVLEIDLNAMLHNLQVFANKLEPETEIIAMVKASAYGSGGAEVAMFLEHYNVERLCVAYTDEGVELRRAGVSLPIMVLNPDRDNLEHLLDYRLEPEVYSMSLLRMYGEHTKGIAPARVPGMHLKIDTGMHRLGFDVGDVPELIGQLSQYPHLKVESVFTHLAAADDPAEDEFTRQQLELFTKAADRLTHGLGYAPLRHALNTFGIARFTEYQFDAVRLGIGLYGAGVSSIAGLLPVHKLHGRVSQLRRVSEGDSVGYGRAFHCKRDSVIATVNVGYADGVPRILGQTGFDVAVGGAVAPIIGRVCMDMCMIDVTDIQNVQTGDLVEFFGETIPIELMAERCETIPYEILTGISERIPRVFKFD